MYNTHTLWPQSICSTEMPCIHTKAMLIIVLHQILMGIWYIVDTNRRILHSNENEQATVTCNNLNESLQHAIEWKKPDTKNTHFIMSSINFKNWLNKTDGDRSHGSDYFWGGLLGCWSMFCFLIWLIIRGAFSFWANSSNRAVKIFVFSVLHYISINIFLKTTQISYSLCLYDLL